MDAPVDGSSFISSPSANRIQSAPSPSSRSTARPGMRALRAMLPSRPTRTSRPSTVATQMPWGTTASATGRPGRAIRSATVRSATLTSERSCPTQRLPPSATATSGSPPRSSGGEDRRTGGTDFPQRTFGGVEHPARERPRRRCARVRNELRDRIHRRRRITRLQCERAQVDQAPAVGRVGCQRDDKPLPVASSYRRARASSVPSPAPRAPGWDARRVRISPTCSCSRPRGGSRACRSRQPTPLPSSPRGSSGSPWMWIVDLSFPFQARLAGWRPRRDRWLGESRALRRRRA